MVKPNGDEKHLENIISVVEWLLSTKQNSIRELAVANVKKENDFFFTIR